MKINFKPKGDISNKPKSELFYNEGSFNIPGLMFLPSVPIKGATRFEPVEVFKNVFLVGDNSVCMIVFKTSEGIIVWDSLEGPSCMVDMLEPDMKKIGLQPEEIKVCLVSHGHFDHYGGAAYLQRKYGSRVYMNELDVEEMESHYQMIGADWFGEYGKPNIDEYFYDGQKITLGDVTFTLMHTPGHTKGSMSFFVPVTAFDGTEHILCCWGGTSAPGDAKGADVYLLSLRKFREYIQNNQVDCFLSVHPFVDYSTTKCEIVRQTRNSSPLIRTPEEMNLFCKALEVYTYIKPEVVESGIMYPFLDQEEFIARFANDSYGFGSDVVSMPHVIYIPEEATGNGSPYLNQILRAEIFEHVYYVGTGTDACIIYDTEDGIVITDAMNDQEDFTKIVKPAMTAFGLNPEQIKVVMLTHGHSDKTGFASYLQKTYGAKIYMNEEDKSLAPSITIDVPLLPEKYQFGKFVFEWIKTPGHTDGCMSYLVNASIEGTEHVIACWGGTSFVYEQEKMVAYYKSIHEFKNRCSLKSADSLISTHPYFNYGVEKVLKVQAGNKHAFVMGKINSLDFSLTVISLVAQYKMNKCD